MPPKKGKGKKKKKSKEELEAEAKARREEEERAQEAERKRLEEERLAREEAERLAKEEADRLRAEQLARLTEEHKADTDRLTRYAKRLREEQARLYEEDDWARFKECSRRPNAALEAELNTYITECGEEEHADVEAGLVACQTTEEIVHDLEEELARALEVGDTAVLERCVEARRRLRDLSAKKVDRVTAHVLEHAYELSTELKEGVRETKVSHGCPAVKLGVWVNLTAKGGRMRSIPYPDLGMSVDIPKPIATQLIAVRILHYPYDHAKSTAAYIDSLAQQLAKEDASAAAGAGGRPESKVRARGRRGSRVDALEDTEEKGVEDEAGTPADASDPAVRTVLGGTFYVELLTLPEPPKRVRQWTLRRVGALATTVQRQPHPMASQALAVAAAQAMKLRVVVPPNVVLPPSPVVASWNAKRGHWTSDGITEQSFDAETRTLTVHTIDLSAMGIVQDRFVDFPFKSWVVEPVGDHVAKLTLQTPRFTVTIEVSGTRCRLLEPDLPELADIRSQSFRPGRLLTLLAAAGINLVPQDADAGLAVLDGSIKPKTHDLETMVYSDVSTLAAAFSIAGSKWNQSAAADAAVLRVKETLEYDTPASEVHETDWRTVLYVADSEAPTQRRVGLIASMESSASYNPSLAPAEVFHTNVLGAVSSRSTPEALDVVDWSRPTFQQTVFHLLRLIRPLSMS